MYNKLINSINSIVLFISAQNFSLIAHFMVRVVFKILIMHSIELIEEYFEIIF